MNLEAAPDTWKSLTELEEAPSSLPYPLDSAVERRIGLLRGSPLAKLTAEDLLLLLGHNIGLPHLIPLAIERLRDEPFLEARGFPGDLLTALLEADPGFWQDNRDRWSEVLEVLETAMQLVEEHRQGGEDLRDCLGDGLAAAILHFHGLHARNGDA